jgi:hypothetical protein
MFLAGFYLTIQLLKITRGWEALDVPQVVLWMPNTAAQLVINPLFRRGVLFFRGGVREDVLGHFFSPKDFFRKQVKAGENKKE